MVAQRSVHSRTRAADAQPGNRAGAGGRSRATRRRTATGPHVMAGGQVEIRRRGAEFSSALRAASGADSRGVLDRACGRRRQAAHARRGAAQGRRASDGNFRRGAAGIARRGAARTTAARLGSAVDGDEVERGADHRPDRVGADHGRRRNRLRGASVPRVDRPGAAFEYDQPAPGNLGSGAGLSLRTAGARMAGRTWPFASREASRNAVAGTLSAQDPAPDGSIFSVAPYF